MDDDTTKCKSCCQYSSPQSAFCNPSDVEAFTEEKKNSLLIKRQGKGADFVRAVEEITVSYDKAKKQDRDDQFNSGDEGTVSNTGNSEGSDGKSWMKGLIQNPVRMSNLHSEILHASMDSNESCNPIDVPVFEMDIAELHAMDTVSEEHIGYSLLRAPFIRRSRSSSKVNPCKLQSFIKPLKGFSKTIEDVARNVNLDESLRSKWTRKSLDTSGRHDVDSPARSAAFASNGSSEDNCSEVVAANSDTISLNEVNTLESSCKVELDETLGYWERGVELNERLDLQNNTVVLKKKRKPNRKRVIQDAAECTARPDKEAIVGDCIIITVPNSPCEKLDERSGKGDGDEHLPLVKRARVRMGKLSREEKELDTSIHTAEKPSDDFIGKASKEGMEHGNSMNAERKPTEEVLFNDLEQVKGAINSSSPSKNCTNINENATIFWKARKYEWRGGLLDGESALPPSKRLHRALEAMSANVAEADQADNETPVTTKMLPNGSSDLSPCHIPAGSEIQNSLEGQNVNFSDISRFDFSLTPTAEVQTEISDIKVCDHLVRSSSSSRKVEPKAMFSEDLNAVDAKDLDDSSVDSEIVKPNVEVRSLQPCSSNFDEEQASLVSGQGLLDQPSVEGGKNVFIDAGNKCSNYFLAGKGYPHEDKTDNEHYCLALESDSVSEAKEVRNFSSLNSTSVLLSDADWGSCEDIKSVKCPSYEKSGDKDMCEVVQEVKHKQTQEGSDAHPRSTPMKVLIAAAQVRRHLSRSSFLSDNPLDNKIVVDAVSISPPTDGFSSAEKVSTSNTSSSHVHALDDRIDTCNSTERPEVLPHHKKSEHLLDVGGKRKSESTVSDRHKSFDKWSVHAEANAARKSFELMLGTLSRTKESIGRATRLAIDSAKYGIASEVVEILARNLESESSLHRKVDLFFLVDSITQCSRGQKGIGDLYLSAVQAVLPRLLSAAAPPGNAARENRKQCLKVLRLWLERKTLPESIIRHHLQEIGSITDVSVTSAFSRWPSRSERALNDPVREMEGMLDEYGSNTSFQLPGFNMPQMLKNEEEGSDSDEKNYEAVTPEHEPEVPLEREAAFKSANEKHRHILEDVDGELEMEDVASSCEVEINCIYKGAGVDSVHTMHCQFDQCFTLPFAPPLPENVQPTPPPLPTSPPPVAPPHPPFLPPSPPPLSAMPRSVTDSGDSSRYMGTHSMENHLPHSIAQQSGSNRVTLDAAPYFAPRYSDLPVPVHRHSSSCSSGSCGTLHGSHRSTLHPGNNVPQTNGASTDNNAYRLPPPPPPPMSSNQFSYVQVGQKLHSWRETSCSSFTKKFQEVQEMNGGDFYAGQDGDRLAPHEINEGCRLSTPIHSGSAHFDKAGGLYTPMSSYYGSPCEPARIPNHRWAFPPIALNYRQTTPFMRPEAPNFWTPR